MAKILIGGAITCAGYEMKILSDVTIRSQDSDTRIPVNVGSGDINNDDSSNSANPYHKNGKSSFSSSNNNSILRNSNLKRNEIHSPSSHNIINKEHMDIKKYSSSTSLSSSSTTTSTIPANKLIDNKYDLNKKNNICNNSEIISTSNHNNKYSKNNIDNNGKSINDTKIENRTVSSNINDKYISKINENEKYSNYHRNTSSSNFTSYPLLDPLVVEVMRPHQREAAVFLLDKLMGKTSEILNNSDSNDNDSNYNDDSNNSKNNNNNNSDKNNNNNNNNNSSNNNK